MVDPSREPPSDSAPERTPGARNSTKVLKMYRKKARRLERDLYAELGKNVDLFNRKNKAAAVLKRLVLENSDLLDVLGKSLGDLNPPRAEKATLSTEQNELFHLETI